MRDMNSTLTFVDLTVTKLMLYDDVLMMMYVLNDPRVPGKYENIVKHLFTSAKCRTIKNSVPCVSLVL